MNKIFDLHSHTLHSDGTLTPNELVQRAHSMGVQVLALTDHDSTAGIAEASLQAATLGIELVPGVEISVTWAKRTIHVVGLGIDIDHAPLQQGLQTMRELRQQRARQMADKLQRCGIEDCLPQVRAMAQGGLISRTHFARVLVERGVAKDFKQAFKKFLGEGKPGFVAVQWAGLDDAISWIVGAGGDAVLAHPARYRFSATKMRLLLAEFKDIGGNAIEVVSGSHTESECEQYARLANQFALRASVGSDYHGPENPWIELGKLRPLSTDCNPIWSHW